MSLFFQSHLHSGGVYGIWHATEDDHFFIQNMQFYPDEVKELSILKARKKTEWLSSRYLLHLLSKREIRGACLKDIYGKPYLENSDYFISISHTSNYTAVISSPYAVGIDVQVIVPKISRIAPKFINGRENNYIPNQDKILYYHAIWGAKESIYKAYGKKELDFIKEIEIGPFVFDSNGFFFQGSLRKGNLVQNYSLFCRQFDQLILVYAIQS